MDVAEPPEQERPIRVSLVFDLGNQALGISVDPPPYPLSRLLSALPPEAREILGWLPDLAVGVSGVLVDPRNGAAGVLATAGLADSAEPSATLILAELPVPDAAADAAVSADSAAAVDADTDKDAAAAPDSPRQAPPKPTKLALLIGLTLDSPITLGGTPLFGALLDGLAIEDLAVSWSSAAIPAGTVILPRPAPPKVDQPAYPQGPELALTLREGSNRESLRLRPPARKTVGPPRTAPADHPPFAGRLPDPLAGPPVQWFPVEKRLGPLTIARIGVVGTDTAFGIALDASLRTASLDVRLTGFTVVFDPRSDISPAAVRVALDGLAVAFGSGKLRIDGGLVRTTEETDDGPVTAYAGSLTIQAGPYGIAAIGSYAEYRGAPSLFVFGIARGRFGGVPAFFVTGLAAGFGYNRRLRLPAIEQVRGFPLVRAVLRATPETDAGSALAELSAGGWVPIASGAYWVSAGIAFTSFGVLDGFVMLVVQFGDRFIVSLLGVVGLRLPKIGTAIAYVELAIDAVLDVDAGEFRANALLTPNSFVFNREGRLSGGFAFRLWFAPHRRAGDFVVCVGGYHPAFDRPLWYPEVPRLAIDWRVSPEIGIAGSAYAAITPSAAMAGGNLDVRFAAGALRAWFTAHADLIVYWRPVYFEAEVVVGVGAAYTLSLGTIHRTLTIELGAQLQLWGPPFTGTAHVRWAVISFSVAINGGRRPALPDKVLDWAQFAADFLPADPAATASASAPASPVCRPRVAAGLIDAVQVGGREEWLVSGGTFALLSETAIPASRLEVEGPDGPGPVFDAPRVGVFPMGSIVVETPHRVRISPIQEPEAAAAALDLSSWTWTPVQTQVPYAVWGTQNPGRAELGSRLIPGTTGLRGTPPTPSPAGPPPVPLDLLDSILIDPRRGFRLPTGEIDGSTRLPQPDSLVVIHDTIDHDDVVRRRGAITELLLRSGITAGVEAGRMNVLAEQVEDVFPARPLLGPPGTTGPLHPVATAPPERKTAPPDAARPGRASSKPDQLRAIFYRHASLRTAPEDQWESMHPYLLTAHVYDQFSNDGDKAIAARHKVNGDTGPTWQIDEGMTLLLAPDLPDRERVLESDGVHRLLVTQLDAQYQVISETSPPPGTAMRIDISKSCILLAVSADEDPGPIRGWTAATVLAHLAPQALLGPGGVVVRPQSPIRVAAGGVRGTRAAGVTSGRTLSAANRVQTPSGSRPGWTDTRFAEPPARLQITLRPQGPVRRGSGPHGEPARVAVRCAEGRLIGLEPVTATAEFDRLHLAYQLSDFSRPGALTVRVQPDPEWFTDAVLGIFDTGREAPGRNSDEYPVAVVLR